MKEFVSGPNLPFIYLFISEKYKNALIVMFLGFSQKNRDIFSAIFVDVMCNALRFIYKNIIGAFGTKTLF